MACLKLALSGIEIRLACDRRPGSCDDRGSWMHWRRRRASLARPVHQADIFNPVCRRRVWVISVKTRRSPQARRTLYRTSQIRRPFRGPPSRSERVCPIGIEDLNGRSSAGLAPQPRQEAADKLVRVLVLEHASRYGRGAKSTPSVPLLLWNPSLQQSASTALPSTSELNARWTRF